MSKKHYVVQDAICECNFGTLPDKLKVLTQSKRYANDMEGNRKLIVTTADIGMTFEKNTFGKCKLQPTSSGFKPCIPALTEWKDFYSKVKLEDNGGNPLLEDSKGICTISGNPCINIKFHGQTSELTKQNIKNANENLMPELFPFVNLKEVGKHKFNVPSELEDNNLKD